MLEIYGFQVKSIKYCIDTVSVTIKNDVLAYFDQVTAYQNFTKPYLECFRLGNF